MKIATLCLKLIARVLSENPLFAGILFLFLLGGFGVSFFSSAPSAPKLTVQVDSKTKEQRQKESDYEGILYKSIFWCRNLKGTSKKSDSGFNIACSEKKNARFKHLTITKASEKLYEGDLFENEKVGTWTEYGKGVVDYRIDYRKLVKLTYEWYSSGFGRIAMVNLKVRNDSDIYLKDIPLSCDFFSESGRKLDSKTVVLFKNFPSYQTISVRELNLGFFPDFSKSLGCELNLSAL